MHLRERGSAEAVAARAQVDEHELGLAGVCAQLRRERAARVDGIGRIKLSANWMCAAGHPGEDAAMYDTVRAVGMELCPALGIAIPVGKDSMSMRTTWVDAKTQE